MLNTLAGRSLCSAIYSCSLYLSLPHNLSFLCSAVESSLISLCLSHQPYLSFIICLHSSCLSSIIFNLSSQALLSLSPSVSLDYYDHYQFLFLFQFHNNASTWLSQILFIKFIFTEYVRIQTNIYTMQTFSYFTSVGLAQARPNNYISNLIIVTCKLKVELLLYDCVLMFGNCCVV